MGKKNLQNNATKQKYRTNLGLHLVQTVKH